MLLPGDPPAELGVDTCKPDRPFRADTYNNTLHSTAL
jgi:hypothetical protein